MGRNAPIAGHDPTAHAEIQALRAAATALGNYRLDGCELFVTLEPCAMCAGAMLHARLKRVVFGALDPKTGAAGSVVNLFEQPQLNHHTQVQGGVLEQACGQLLRDFFRDKRLRDDRNAATCPLREDALRTPDARFSALPDYPWPARYVHDLPALAGLRMHYLDVGGDLGADVGSGEGRSEGNDASDGNASAGTTFLCLHGPADWSYSFRYSLAAWSAAGHRVVAPDLIGFGKSDKPKRASAHTPEFHRQCLLELLEHLDLQLSQTVLVVQDSAFALGQSLLSGAHGSFKSLQTVVLQPGPQDLQARECPFPDAGHRAALRAFPLIWPSTLGVEDSAPVAQAVLAGLAHGSAG